MQHFMIIVKANFDVRSADLSPNVFIFMCIRHLSPLLYGVVGKSFRFLNVCPSNSVMSLTRLPDNSFQLCESSGPVCIA
jgi:hypothetical protein